MNSVVVPRYVPVSTIACDRVYAIISRNQSLASGLSVEWTTPGCAPVWKPYIIYHPNRLLSEQPSQHMLCQGRRVTGYAHRISESIGCKDRFPQQQTPTAGYVRCSPDSGTRSAIIWVLGVHGNKIRVRRVPQAAEAMVGPPGSAGAGCFAILKPHLCRRCLSHLTSSPGHAVAGGARNRAIIARISGNICRGTATSAIWNVT